MIHSDLITHEESISAWALEEKAMYEAGKQQGHFFSNDSIPQISLLISHRSQKAFSFICLCHNEETRSFSIRFIP